MASFRDTLHLLIDVDGSGAAGSVSKLRTELANTDGAFNKLKVGASGAFSLVRDNALAMVGGVAAAVTALYSAVQAASDLEETVAASQVVFGESAAEIEDFGENAAQSLGMSKQAAIDAATTFAVLGKSAGLAGDDLVTFSTDMVGLAADLASFKNTSPQEAIEAIGAALRGEAEPIRKYGVLLDDARLKARAMEMGIYDGVGALTAQERALAAQAEILAQTSDAQGDFARTSDGLANKQRVLAAEFQNLKADVGGALVPALTDATAALLAFKAVAEDIGGINIAGWSILDSAKWSSPLKLGSEAFTRLRGAIDDVRGSTEITATVWDTGTEAVAELDTATQELTNRLLSNLTTIRNVASAQDRANESARLAKDRLDAQRAAQQALRDEMLRAVGQTFAYEEANLRLTTGMRAFEQAVASGERSAEELRLEEIALAGQALQTAEAFASEQRASGNAASAADLQRFALVRLQGQFPALHDEIQQYINRLNAIPRSVTTNIVTRLSTVTASGAPARNFVKPEERASGGPVRAGEPYLVGEDGPEVVVPNANGTVVPSGRGRGGGLAPIIQIPSGLVLNGPALGRFLSDELEKHWRRNGRAS